MTPLKLMQLENAPSPILVTLLGIVMLVKLVQLLNAVAPMLVTGRPLRMFGMVNALPDPVYLVMVIMPL